MPAFHVEPGEVGADSLPIVGVLDLGCYPVGADDAARSVAADLSSSGFRSRADPQVMRWKYEKLLLNLATAVRAICGPETSDDEADRQLRAVLVERLEAEARACLAGRLWSCPPRPSGPPGGRAR
jgi:2-dehydropantoate 2-reductase